jgi:hypothetical protein
MKVNKWAMEILNDGSERKKVDLHEDANSGQENKRRKSQVHFSNVCT